MSNQRLWQGGLPGSGTTNLHIFQEGFTNFVFFRQFVSDVHKKWRNTHVPNCWMRQYGGCRNRFDYRFKAVLFVVVQQTTCPVDMLAEHVLRLSPPYVTSFVRLWVLCRLKVKSANGWRELWLLTQGKPAVAPFSYWNNPNLSVFCLLFFEFFQSLLRAFHFTNVLIYYKISI